jgi:hypothetical protein
MQQLLYVSRSKLDISEQVCQSILEKARQKNTSEGVTGLLMSKGDTFVQFLEGDSSRLMPIYGEICADERHRDITTLFNGESGQRIFNNWAMAHREGSDFDGDLAAKVKKIFDSQCGNADTLEAADLLNVLQSIRYTM